jgi:hypothetical protein
MGRRCGKRLPRMQGAVWCVRARSRADSFSQTITGLQSLVNTPETLPHTLPHAHLHTRRSLGTFKRQSRSQQHILLVLQRRVHNPQQKCGRCSPTPTTVRQAPARTVMELSGGDEVHPCCQYFIHLIQRLAQNVGIWRRWESSVVTSLATLFGRNEEPTSSDIAVTSPFWAPLIRTQLTVLHLLQHHFRVGPSGCGPLLS